MGAGVNTASILATYERRWELAVLALDLLNLPPRDVEGP